MVFTPMYKRYAAPPHFTMLNKIIDLEITKPIPSYYSKPNGGEYFSSQMYIHLVNLQITILQNLNFQL